MSFSHRFSNIRCFWVMGISGSLSLEALLDPVFFIIGWLYLPLADEASLILGVGSYIALLPNLSNESDWYCLADYILGLYWQEVTLESLVRAMFCKCLDCGWCWRWEMFVISVPKALLFADVLRFTMSLSATLEIDPLLMTKTFSLPFLINYIGY